MIRLLRSLPGLVFGLLFATGGLFILSETALPTWQNWRAMQNWQLTYAQLLSVSGDDNQTRARYRYNYDGHSYQGDRVYVADINDNIGSYHADLLKRLRGQLHAGEPIPVWVNPLIPQQAVIDRDMRWGLFALMTVFCSVFIFIGLLVTYISIRSEKNQSGFKQPSLLVLRKEWKQRGQNPEFNDSFVEFSKSRIAELKQQAKPAVKKNDWRTRKAWASSTIASEAGKGTLIIWGFAIFWNAISTPVIFFLPEEWGKGNYLALIALIFPIVGAFLIYKAVLASLEYRRFGKVLLTMDPYPGAIGGHMGGKIRVSHLDYQLVSGQAANLTVRLECVYSYMSGSGDSRSRNENIKWAEQGQPRLQGQGQGVDLSFRFDIPDNLPEADVEQSDAYHFWRLTLKADIEGIDLNRQYNIPVFNTGARSRFIQHDVSAQVLKHREQASQTAKTSIAEGNFDIPGLSRAMRLSELGDEINLEFPMFRNKVLTLFAASFAGAFGIASFMMISSALESGGFGIFIALFSVPFLLVGIVAGLATIYLAFNSLSVRIKPGSVSVIRRLLLFPVYSRLLETGDISHLSTKRSGSTGQGVDKILHFKLLAHNRNGKSVTIAEDLDGEDVAAHFRDYIAQRLNLKSGDALTFEY